MLWSERGKNMVNKEKRDKIMKKARSVIKANPNEPNIKSDVNGSYTGVPLNKNDRPVQDADDL